MRLGLKLRHLLAILLLPFVVVVVVPGMLLSAWTVRSDGVLAVIGMVVGATLFVTGFCVFGSCVVLFARVGRGTLAPWDPTQRLVAIGPYRFVRNPMISSVATMLVGQAAFFGSVPLLVWAVIFVVINHIYFLVSEEPGLERRFGAAYVEYRRRVPRWLPRATSFTRSGKPSRRRPAAGADVRGRAREEPGEIAESRCARGRDDRGAGVRPEAEATRGIGTAER